MRYLGHLYVYRSGQSGFSIIDMSYTKQNNNNNKIYFSTRFQYFSNQRHSSRSFLIVVSFY